MACSVTCSVILYLECNKGLGLYRVAMCNTLSCVLRCAKPFQEVKLVQTCHSVTPDFQQFKQPVVPRVFHNSMKSACSRKFMDDLLAALGFRLISVEKMEQSFQCLAGCVLLH